MWSASRRQRSLLIRATILCAVVLTVGTLYLITAPDPTNSPVLIDRDHSEDGAVCDAVGGHKLAVIVPFRDRFEELQDFIPHMRQFLLLQNICHEIFIVNQVDSLRFNRGALINIGYWLSVNASCDYIAMHDVDLLPRNQQLSYSYPAYGPLHLAAPGLHPKYNYSSYVGGILLMTNQHFIKVNGLSNRFWGWGREDDEFYRRLNESRLQIHRPTNITTGNETFRHNHENSRRRRDNIRYGRQTKMRKDRKSGIHNVDFVMMSRNELTINGWSAHIVNVQLKCNIRDTPWCMTPQQLAATMKSLHESLPPEQFNEIDNEVRSKMSYDEYL